MRRLMSVIISLAILLIGVGFYRGWFALSSTDADPGHKTNVNLTVDEDKMREDAATVSRRTGEIKDDVIGKETIPTAP
jgi:hypothetical protein